MSTNKKTITEKHSLRIKDTRSKAEKLLFKSDVSEIARAFAALIKYARRQERSEHPEGTFDNARRWYPTAEEDCGVTKWARDPSRSFPFSYMSACRSLDHCEDLLGADHSVVLKARKWIKEEAEITSADFLKTAEKLSLTLEKRLLQEVLPEAIIEKKAVARL